jgi:hypothetical protein
MKSLHFLKHSNAKLFVTAGVIVVALFMVLQSSEPHRAELRFTEKSDTPTILGSMLPASCESNGGNELVGPDHVGACVWTPRCGPEVNPITGTRFRSFEQSNDDTVDYKDTGGSCPPAVNINIEN